MQEHCGEKYNILRLIRLTGLMGPLEWVFEMGVGGMKECFRMC